MPIKAGDIVENRHTKRKYSVVIPGRVMLLRDNSGNECRFCADAFVKLEPNSNESGSVKRGLKEYN